jgi:hypothetical protein
VAATPPAESAERAAREGGAEAGRAAWLRQLLWGARTPSVSCAA